MKKKKEVKVKIKEIESTKPRPIVKQTQETEFKHSYVLDGTEDESSEIIEEEDSERVSYIN